MPKVTLSNGKEYDIDYVYYNDISDVVRVSMHTDLRIPEVASDFDANETVTYTNGESIRRDYIGYTALTDINKYNGVMSITLEKEARNAAAV